MSHQITRVRHETRRRSLTVNRKEQVTPNMLRIWLGGDDLAGFTSLGADDHVKVFVPGAGEKAEMRDYTPRRYDEAAGELAIDFAIHDAGPATAWAIESAPGDTLEIGGPRGSMVVPTDFDWFLLIGDETALPAIGRRLEELPSGLKVITLAAVTGPEEEQAFDTAADHTAIWIHRPAARAADPEALLEPLRALDLPAGDGFVWIAAEADVVRGVRRHVLEERGHPLPWSKASGYWIKGKADSTEKFES
jgi:NADPH-dependent ferric siderophore reductase